MERVRAVAIAETFDPKTGESDFIQCLGAFDSLTSAYGEAALHLTEMAVGTYEYGNKDEECTISPLRELEGETGYGMYLRNKAGETLDAVFILHAKYEKESGGGRECEASS